MMKKIVVTGCATGMGRTLVEELRDEGCTVVGLDIVPVDVVDQFVQVDLASEESILAAAAVIGEFDAVVHCAGVPENDLDPATVLGINFLGLRALTEALLPLLSDGGAIVSISSMAGHRFRDRLGIYERLLRTASFDEGLDWLEGKETEKVLAGRSIYSVSKEAVWAYTLALAARLLPRRIRVNSVAPGVVQTRLADAFMSKMSDDARLALEATSGGPLLPAEITPVIRFLLSDGARRVNGQNILVDGGYIAGVEALGKQPSSSEGLPS